MISKELKLLFTKSKVLGSGELSIILSNEQVLGVLNFIQKDLSHFIEKPYLINTKLKETDSLYSSPLSSILGTSNRDALDILNNLCMQEQDIATYFKCLMEIYKRRLKFRKILENQKLPTMEQIIPRCLLEYGMLPEESLATWLTWRKWLYDIDNRSAQETGYVFEPIIAAALGGESYSAQKSPIRRSSNRTKGRQVDCLIDDKAYEIKMRITIAASGQGRFKEELEFAEDCEDSGFRPILLVLDSTPSSKLSEISDQYQLHGGEVYIGESAWNHILQEAGDIMSIFVNKYVKNPIHEVEKASKSLKSLSINVEHSTTFKLIVGPTSVIRRKLQPLPRVEM